MKKIVIKKILVMIIISNINEVIRVISCLFHKKILHAQKSLKSKQATFAQMFFICTKKSIKRKQATFTQMFFYMPKKA